MNPSPSCCRLCVIGTQGVQLSLCLSAPRQMVLAAASWKSDPSHDTRFCQSIVCTICKLCAQRMFFNKVDICTRCGQSYTYDLICNICNCARLSS